jgi:hypothetical protein
MIWLAKCTHPFRFKKRFSLARGFKSQFHLWDPVSGDPIGLPKGIGEGTLGFETAALSNDDLLLALATRSDSRSGSGYQHAIRIWSLQSTDLPAEDLLTLAELISGRRLSSGYLTPLQSQEIAGRLRELQGRQRAWLVTHSGTALE